jgi:hypothetical protein
VFDFADTTQPCSQRNISTVAPQALALLNNPFVHEQSREFAARVIREAGEQPSAQIDRAWWLALSRAPSDAERAAALAHMDMQCKNFAGQSGGDAKSASDADLRQQALASLCHVLLNTNEFIYVD